MEKSTRFSLTLGFLLVLPFMVMEWSTRTAEPSSDFHVGLVHHDVAFCCHFCSCPDADRARDPSGYVRRRESGFICPQSCSPSSRCLGVGRSRKSIRCPVSSARPVADRRGAAFPAQVVKASPDLRPGKENVGVEEDSHLPTTVSVLLDGAVNERLRETALSRLQAETAQHFADLAPNVNTGAAGLISVPYLLHSLAGPHPD
jgi:hypothetical protein